MKPAKHNLLPLAALSAITALLLGGSGAVGGGARRAAGHVPYARMARSQHLGRHDGAQRLQLAISLQLRDQAGLNDLLGGLYDPADPRFHQFLTAEEFRTRYAPSDDDVASVAQYLSARGLTVREVTGNNLLLNVEGPASAIESAFDVELHDYITPDGRTVFANTSEPLLVGDAAERVANVNGLSTFSVRRPHKHVLSRIAPDAVTSRAIGDYMTPAKIRTAYGLSSIAQTGAGETLALFELDGYNTSDIQHFATYFGLTLPALQNILVSDGSTTPNGNAGANTDEVALDIEVAMAAAPGLSKIMVYEGPNTDQGVLNTYSKIAADNVAKEVSTSWGEPEDGPTASYRASENAIFQQMAAQGQSIFAASGDSGAYDDYANRPTTLVVDDPASQPYVTAVGGTTLTANAASGAYVSETTWGDSANHEGGGGGISAFWTQPSWQNGLNTTANKGSATMRMTPDVSLDANPTTGYPVYVTEKGQSSGAWYAIGGTSAAAPIWAAFMAIVNQGRLANSLNRIGFANPSIYSVGKSSLYPSSFHDIADGATNLYYPTQTGYDLATGWGTIKGAGLFAALTANSSPPNPPASLTLISSSSSLTANWTASTGATSYKVYRSPTGASGSYTAIATGVTGTSYVDTTSTGINYYYVTAVNAYGESSASPVQSGAANQSPPGAPSGLTGTVSK